MRKLDNGKSGAMFINYDNAGDVGGDVTVALNAILNNDDITWPCWTNNEIIKTFTTTVDANGIELDQEFASELIINERSDVITQRELKIFNTDIGDISFDDTNEDGEADIGNDGSIQTTFVTPEQRRNPVAVVADFELCRSDTSLCNLDTIECPDGSLVGRDPNNDCEFYDCPDINLIGEILCASDRLQCDDGTIVRRNASLGCAFNECPPCDNDDDDDERTRVGRRLLNENNRY